MKIICLLGSPRRDGNSTAIAKRFIETAASLGAETATFELNRLNYRGCQGCCTCKKGLDTCVLKDDLTGVLEAVKEADVLVLASPVYCYDLSGQLKCFIDRTYCYLTPVHPPSASSWDWSRPWSMKNWKAILKKTPPWPEVNDPECSRVPPGKKVVLILTQGNANERLYSDIPRKYDAYLKRLFPFAEVHLIRARGVGTGGIPKDVPEKFLQQAEETARAIVT